MRGTITLDSLRLGPLEVCADPPLLYWRGERQDGWRPAQVRLLAALIELPVVEPAVLAARLGIAMQSLEVRLCTLRAALRVSGLPIRIATMFAPDSQRVDHYRLEID